MEYGLPNDKELFGHVLPEDGETLNTSNLAEGIHELQLFKLSAFPYRKRTTPLLFFLGV